MRPAWLHLSDSQQVTDDVLERATRMRVGGLILPQPHFGAARYTKRYFRERGLPDPIIVGRFYGNEGFDTWHLPFTNLPVVRQFGTWCAAYLELPDSGEADAQPYWKNIDIVQWANEPSIEWKYPNGTPWTGSQKGWEDFRDSMAAWIAGYRYGKGRALAGTVPHSPGQREDDSRHEGTGENWGYRGADICRPARDLYDVDIWHAYWNSVPGSHLDPYWGLRPKRLSDAYGSVKPFVVAETNRPNTVTDEEKKQTAFQWRENMRELAKLPGFMGSAWFIDQSPNPDFDTMQVIKNPWLIEIAREVNAPMPTTPTILYTPDFGKAVSGQTFKFSGAGTGFEALNVIYYTLEFPRREDGFAYAVNPFGVIEVQLDGNGRGSFAGECQVPVFPDDMPNDLPGRLMITTSEGNPDFSYDGVIQAYPVSFTRAAAQKPAPVLPKPKPGEKAPEPKPEPKNQDALINALTVIHYAAGDAAKEMKDIGKAEEIQKLVAAIKKDEGITP